MGADADDLVFEIKNAIIERQYGEYVRLLSKARALLATGEGGAALSAQATRLSKAIARR